MTRPRTVEEPGVGRVEIFPLPTEEDFLLGLLTDVFENHWHEIVFGSLVQGAVFEIAVPEAPKRIGLLDGYLTVHFGTWHFHVCIGEHTGPGKTPTPPEVAMHRRCARAEMVRALSGDGTPRSWQLRLFNGKDEQMMTVFFPHPYITRDENIRQEPDWSRLAMWDKFRALYLGLEPDPLDRSAGRSVCGGA